MHRPAAVAHPGGVPRADRAVRPADEFGTLLGGAAELPRQPDAKRRQQSEVPGGVPGLEVQVLAEHGAHVVGRALPSEDQPLEVGDDTLLGAAGVEVLRCDPVRPLHVVEGALPQVPRVERDAVVVRQLVVPVEHPAHRYLSHRVLGGAPGAGHGDLDHELVHARGMAGCVIGFASNPDYRDYRHYTDYSQQFLFRSRIYPHALREQG